MLTVRGQAATTQLVRMPPAIHVERVDKYFASRGGDLVQALAEVDLEIQPGQFVSLVGPSGCGKSTLLRLLVGLGAPSSGSIEVGGTPVAGPRREVSLVFQQPLLLPWATILQNVLLPVEIQHLDRRAALERAAQLLEMVGLSEFNDRYPKELSGGMQQRAALVRGLVTGPGLLLLDEPFAALDAMTRERLNLELLAIWERTRKTVVLVTHSIDEAVFLSDRVVCFSPRPGRIVRDIPIDLPRPRTLHDRATPAFDAAAAEIRDL